MVLAMFRLHVVCLSRLRPRQTDSAFHSIPFNTAEFGSSLTKIRIPTKLYSTMLDDVESL